MAEPDVTREEAINPPTEPVGPTRPLDATIFGPPGGEPEHAAAVKTRVAFYAVVAALLGIGAFFAKEAGQVEGRLPYMLIEAQAMVLALVVGALALVRFYSLKRSTFLLLGTGFLGTAFLDGYHVFVTSDLFTPYFTGDLQADAVAWSWTASRTFLSIFLFGSWFEWRREGREGFATPLNETSVYATAGFLTLAIFAFFVLAPLSSAYHPDFVIPRLGALVPGVIFTAALIGYLRKGAWRENAFEHWLVVALIVSVLTQFGYAALSPAPYDPRDLGASLLKVVSYITFLTGLLTSVYVTFRREAAVVTAVRQANEQLAREVKVRRDAERVLQESEDRLQDFLDNASDLILSTSPDGTVEYVNRVWDWSLGRKPESMIGSSIFSVVHPDSERRLRTAFRRALRGETVSRVEVEFLAEDGSVAFCSGSLNCRFDEGRPAAVRGIFRDETERRRAERNLALSEANLAALVENTGEGIWSVDRKHRLITFNSGFALRVESMTGHEPKVGDPPDAVFSPETAAWFRELYDEALEGRRFSRDLTEEVDGETQYFELFFNPIQGEAGIEGVVAFGKDVTRRRRAEQALMAAKEEAEAANRAKSQFLASMSHELRTPLNSVIGFANVLLRNRQGNLTDEQLGFLERVLANGRHLLTLINQVLDLAKIEAGRMELETEAVDLRTMVPDLLLQLEGQIRAKKAQVALRGEVPSDLAPIETDPDKLKQIVINLVGNALKFTEKGEVVVRVVAEPDTGEARAIEVQDTGIGIPADRLKAIFEAFQQADGSTARRYGGTGLGLTISRSLCELLGYDLSVDSVEGEGSTFTITIPERPSRWMGPAADPDGEQVRTLLPEPVRAREGSREYLVLVIDDEADSRILMTHYLRDLGCRVMTAESAEEGMAVAREVRPDLVTLDLMMPTMSGWEALKHFKTDPDLREIPVVIASVVAREGRERLLGAVDLVTKPIEREDLLRVLWRNLVQGRGGRVLVVDDDDDTRTLIEAQLEDAGIEVDLARDGEEGLRAVAESAPDAVLLDLMMPGMDGMTFLSRLRAQPEHVGLPVIVVTAKDLSDEERRLLREQASGVIQKGVGAGADLREALGALFPRSVGADPRS